MDERQHVKRRLEELRREFESNQQRLAAAENHASDLRLALLRISGAIQVLEGMLEEEPGA